MFKVLEWSPNLDLNEFYREADRRGFKNNSSQAVLVDCFNNEREKQVWILYYNDAPIGSVAAHSFDNVMGDNAYRIAARTCVFTDKIDGVYGKALRTKRVITENQNPTAQFLIPICIEWAPLGSRLFITSNENSVGTQRRVHRVFGPLMEKQGMMKRINDVVYRNTLQTVWELFPDKFYQVLNKHPRWPHDKIK
jgi:hypothetical protein